MKDNANPCDSGRFRCETCPRAAPENQITGTQYRFTVLTPRLIRMEYAPSGAFEDRASQTVFFRDFPACTFQAERKDGLLTVNTGELLLTYRENEPFSPDTLCLRLLHEPGAFWHYGEDYEDLGGTAETLDGIDGAVPIGRGVCSMHGFSVLDDSHTMLLNAEGWVEVRPARTLDVYFFGYGFSYRDAVRDFYRLTGAPAMLPAYAMGNWWSRYYPYTQDEYLALMDRFREEDIPFSVGVVDMDWHIVNISEELRDDTENWQTKWRPGWTGYTWNATLFPDHRAFLQGLHKRNLKTALCLHPASGVRRHEVQYAEMAKRLGVQNGQRIPFDILSPKYMALYFDVLHHPYEADGVDFWWLDWQQGKDYKWIHEIAGDPLDARECLDPLWMLNHLHTLDISRTGKRPMLFSRYAGPGSHRYAIGFSGDSGVSWESLRFQPYFTAAASNIGYCWWSHDIGGHYGGYRDDELTLRWIQLGTFSPISRLHSSTSHFIRKEPWFFPPEITDAMKQALRLRHQLFPYLYTMNHRCHTELEPMIQPMYYSHPKCGAAYTVPQQFWFGSELIVAPICEHTSEKDGLARADAWLPAGDWFDFFSGLHYISSRGRKLELYRTRAQYPVLAKAGAIVPMMCPAPKDNRLYNCPDMQVRVFPGQNGCFTLYEDSGEGNAYQSGAFAETELTLDWGTEACFTIHPAQGERSLIPAVRCWEIQFTGFHRDAAVSALVGERAAEVCPVYDPAQNTLTVTITAPVTARIHLLISGPSLMHDNADRMERCMTLLQSYQAAHSRKQRLLDVLRSLDPGIKPEKLPFRLAPESPEDSHFIRALVELLTLTAD